MILTAKMIDGKKLAYETRKKNRLPESLSCPEDVASETT
jgi:hypothetical protein